MTTLNSVKYKTKRENLFLRVAKGHFATNNRHSNYYVDVVLQKASLTEAQAIAEELSSYFGHSTVVDTVLCLDGMEVVGTCLAAELTKANFINMNAHQTIYVVTPEHTSGSQIIFRDNLLPMIKGKNVLILAASVTTGYTALAAVEAIKYYGGNVAGICSIFATVKECAGYEIKSIFDTVDLGNYASYPSHECPLCKEGKKIEALVNSFGYSKL